MIEFLKWNKGRNGPFLKPYMVMSLLPIWLSKLIKRDIVLIKMEPGSSVKPHLDNDMLWKGYRVRRTNYIKPSIKGGRARICNSGFGNVNVNVNPFGAIKKAEFSPDFHIHSVSPVIKGTRWVLSFGKYTRDPELVDISALNIYYDEVIPHYLKRMTEIVDIVKRIGSEGVTISCNPWVPNEFCQIGPNTDPVRLVAQTLYVLDGEESLNHWFQVVLEYADDPEED